jgi:GNAT superfamily N-acetyltransferase
MRSTTCFCGAELAADDTDALVPVALHHFTEHHAELGLTATHVRDYLDAEERLTGGTERLATIGTVEVHDVTADRLTDVLRFFDHDAFADNLAWAACYCMCHHVGTQDEWMARSAAENRTDLCRRIEAGTTTGVLAYVDGDPAAWCNGSPRTAFPEHVGRDDHPDDEVGSIVCFVVAPPYRRHGLAERLLDEACRSFARRGLRVAEAYPRDPVGGDADAYHGPLSLYLGAGFARGAEGDGHVVVQRPLDAPTS